MSARLPSSESEPIRVVRIIARLNVGGPAIQAITLTKELDSLGYRTTLVRGREEPDEGTMEELADELGVRPVLLPWMRRNLGWQDLVALAALARTLRRERPQIVHTHAAKGGALGRMAALLAFPGRRGRPVLIHTFHGHSLIGYFSPRTAEVYRRVERFLARRTDRLVAVSEQVRDDLVRLGVAPASKFDVVPLGFDLSPFAVRGEPRTRLREALRAELGIPSDALVVTLVARLVPIKRVDRFLEVATGLLDRTEVRFLIVGDGELREELQDSWPARLLEDRLVWAGFRRDMPAVFFTSDVAVLTSDNEGTPVSLIEAQAAGVPVVSTNVGGTPKVVVPDWGVLVARDDLQGFGKAIRQLLDARDSPPGAGYDRAATTRDAFALPRLIGDIVGLYRTLLLPRSQGTCVTRCDTWPPR